MYHLSNGKIHFDCQLISTSFSFSLAEIRMTHLDRPYFVTMGTYQMAVLLQFNDHEHMTIYELEEATKLNIKELDKQVSSLIDAKFLLNDSANALASDTKISINYDYKNKRTKFKVPLISQKEASHVKFILNLTTIFHSISSFI